MTVTPSARPGPRHAMPPAAPGASGGHRPLPPQQPALSPAPSLADFSPTNLPGSGAQGALAQGAGVPLSKRPLFTPKVVLWSMLGLVAAAYMGIMLVEPALIDDLSPTSAYITDPQSSQGQRAAARLVSDVSGLKESMAQVQLEIAKVKTEVATSAEQTKALSAQLVALQDRLAHSSGAALDTSEPQPDGNQGQRAVTAPKAVVPPETQASTGKQAGSPQQPKLVNAPPESSLETGSVTQDAKPTKTAKSAPPAKEAPAKEAQAKSWKSTVADVSSDPVDFGATEVKTAGAGIGVQISSGASLDSLRLSWSLLADRHRDSLNGLRPRYVARGDMSNPTYDLIAGPLKSTAEAQRLCKSLIAQNVPCTVANYIGAAL
ncbi:MAG: hypothetical protein AB7S74_03220 [Hyphomicrobium sp.]